MPGTESTGMPHNPAREVWAFALLMGAMALLVFQFTRDPATYNRSDNFWYVPTAQSLRADGDVELRAQYDALIRDTASWNWMSIETPKGRVNYFGFGTSVLVLPVVALGNPLHADLPPGDRDAAIAALAARVLAAISVGLLLVAAAALGASLPQAVLLAAILTVAPPTSPCMRVACGRTMPSCSASWWPSSFWRGRRTGGGSRLCRWPSPSTAGRRRRSPWP